LQEQVHASPTHPTKGKDEEHCNNATRREDSCPWERVSHVLISLSAISALERSREFTAAAAGASLTSWIESLTSVDASEFLTSSITAMTKRAGTPSLDHVDQEKFI